MRVWNHHTTRDIRRKIASFVHRPCQVEVNRARVGFIQGLLSVLFFLFLSDFFSLAQNRAPWHYRIYSSIILTLPEISRALHSVYRQSQHPARRRSVMQGCLGSQWTRRVWQLSILANTAQENIVFAVPLLHQPCLKFRVWKAEITRKLAWARAKKLSAASYWL